MLTASRAYTATAAVCTATATATATTPALPPRCLHRQANFHHQPRIVSLLRDIGVRFIYLAAYDPRHQAIEPSFNQVHADPPNPTRTGPAVTRAPLTV